MSKAKFRGKTHYSKWIYGGTYDNFIVEDIKDTDNSSTLFKVESTTLTMDRTIRVLEDTIGQYTGEHDDNGVEIYEGDIVLCKDYNEDEYTSTIRYNDGAFTVDVSNYDYDQTAIGWAIESDIESIKVIGNKYDNPELLEN